MRSLSMPVVALLAPVMVAPGSQARKVTNIADIEWGPSVTLRGEVTRILDEDEFRLQDDTGSVKVYIG